MRESLKNEKKKRSRGKLVFAIPSDTAAVFYLPAKLKAGIAALAEKEQLKVVKKKQKQEQAMNKKVAMQLRAEQRSQAAVDRQVKAAQKRAQKAAEKESKEVNLQLKTDLQASTRKARPAKRRVKKKELVVVLKLPSVLRGGERAGAQAAESS
ncbi:unnamed protein product [Zymoseptoria tritici ST99CH_1A5]|uniref:Uncharacterized protein n=1 Tax=Zymoseptoria tritici ST99CH_1A5 TaxID=1276529 RepID=A0A1Y6L9B9_ZYMTR|nr:unnamed protein product [Zymoseptoria tritici ST99CH_1A5]